MITILLNMIMHLYQCGAILQIHIAVIYKLLLVIKGRVH